MSIPARATETARAMTATSAVIGWQRGRSLPTIQTGRQQAVGLSDDTVTYARRCPQRVNVSGEGGCVHSLIALLFGDGRTAGRQRSSKTSPVRRVLSIAGWRNQ